MKSTYARLHGKAVMELIYKTRAITHEYSWFTAVLEWQRVFCSADWFATSLVQELGLCRASGSLCLSAKEIQNTKPLLKETAGIKCNLVKPREGIDSSTRLL